MYVKCIMHIGCKPTESWVSKICNEKLRRRLFWIKLPPAYVCLGQILNWWDGITCIHTVATARSLYGTTRFTVCITMAVNCSYLCMRNISVSLYSTFSTKKLRGLSRHSRSGCAERGEEEGARSQPISKLPGFHLTNLGLSVREPLVFVSRDMCP